ncbi:hypothetical protein GCM10019017_20020 [Streptomyces showdoensis]
MTPESSSVASRRIEIAAMPSASAMRTAAATIAPRDRLGELTCLPCVLMAMRYYTQQLAYDVRIDFAYDVRTPLAHDARRPFAYAVCSGSELLRTFS